MKKIVLLPALAMTLASCSILAPSSMDYTLAPQKKVTTTAPAFAPAGKATVRERVGTVRTSIELSGMIPQAIYVAHFHKQGKADTAPCESGGAAIMESKMVAQADLQGKVRLEGLVATSVVKDATYLNVHTARDFEGTPADSGVICTPVTVQ